MSTGDKIININHRKEPLTVEKLKQMLGRKDMSEEEAKEMLHAIKTLVSILIDYQYEQGKEQQNNTDTTYKQTA